MDVVVPHAAWCPVGCQRAISVGPHQHVLTGAWHCWCCKTQLLKRVVLIGLKKTEHITHSCETGAVCVRAFSYFSRNIPLITTAKLSGTKELTFLHFDAKGRLIHSLDHQSDK